MAGAITDLLDRVTDSTTGRPVIGALASPGKAMGAGSIAIQDATNWTTSSAVHISIYKTTTIGSAQVKDPTTQTDWKGTLAGTTISNLTLTGGTDRAYNVGDIVEITPTARWAKDLYDWGMSFANQDGSLKAAAVQTALGLGSSNLNGYNALGFTPNTVSYLGNHCYQLTYNGVDLTGTLSNGMRLRMTRTTAAPTQCSSLSGTNQYWSKTSPAGMNFTDTFTIMGHIKLTSYSSSTLTGRISASQGFYFGFTTAGQIIMAGRAATTDRSVTSVQSLPLNKWVHIAATIQMSTNTGVIYIDGELVPSTMSGSPTALVQASGTDFIVGQDQGARFFPGKIEQLAVFSTVLSQSTIQSYISQGLAGTETGLISAYSFNGNANDLNTTNANNLTSNNGSSATSADAPFAQGATAGSFEYGIQTSISFSTNTVQTVQVPEGSAIPTSGGVSAVVYSSNKAPYGFPIQRGKWIIESYFGNAIATKNGATDKTWYNGGAQITVPAGEWILGYKGSMLLQCASTAFVMAMGTLSTTNNSETNPQLTTSMGQNSVALSQLSGQVKTEAPVSVATQTIYYLNQRSSTATGTINLYFYIDTVPSGEPTFIRAECAYL